MGLQLRVVERDSSVAGAYCGRMLGMFGADVIKLEPPEGDTMRNAEPILEGADGEPVSALFEYLNAFKRSVAVDPADTESIDGLLDSADLVIDYVDGEADAALREHARLASRNPRLIHIALSAFGLTGPYRDYKGNEFIDFASGGYTFITGDPDREPVQAGAPVAGYVVGTTATIAALSAARSRDRSGRGQLVDVGAMEAMAAAHQWTIVLFTHQGVIKRRAGNRHAESYNPMGPVPCKDGWVSLGVASAAQWEGFCLAIDVPELLADDRFQTGGDRFDHADELAELTSSALMSMTAAELVERCHEHHVPASPVIDVAAVLSEPQLEERRYWVASERIGDRARMPERPLHLPWMEAPFRRAPSLGEHTEEVISETAETTGRAGA